VRPIFLFGLVAFAVGLAHTETRAQSSILFESPVKITALVRAEPKVATPSTVTTFDITVSPSAYEFRFAVTQPGPFADALAALKKKSGWKDGVLFIRDDCASAPLATHALRCAVDQVFTFVDAPDGVRLVHLGDVFAGEDCIEEAKFGCSLYRGVFTDVYDVFESNAFVDRQDIPAPLVEMRAVSGQLTVDLDETWGRNQERFTAGERCLVAKPAERAEMCTEGITRRGAYLFNSILATYTKRDDELMRIRAFARAALCEEKSNDDSACSDALRKSALMLVSIRPGEKPRLRGNVKSVAISTNATNK
jgi:hypothetical protein